MRASPGAIALMSRVSSAYIGEIPKGRGNSGLLPPKHTRLDTLHELLMGECHPRTGTGQPMRANGL